MTQEEKQLLIKDFCARLPYDVKIRTNENDESYTLLAIHPNKDIAVIGLQFDDVFATSKIKIEDIKPYLRPMSSMTVEEKKEYNSFSKPTGHRKVWINRIDWLNRKMFDYRGLIEKGLAIEVTYKDSIPVDTIVVFK